MPRSPKATTPTSEELLTKQQSFDPRDFDLATAQIGDVLVVRRLAPNEELTEIQQTRGSGYRDERFINNNALCTVTAAISSAKIVQASSSTGYTVRLVPGDDIFILTRKTPFEPTSVKPIPEPHYRDIAQLATQAQQSARGERSNEESYVAQAMECLRNKDVPTAQRLLGQSSQANRNAQAWELIATALDNMLQGFLTDVDSDTIKLELPGGPASALAEALSGVDSGELADLLTAAAKLPRASNGRFARAES